MPVVSGIHVWQQSNPGETRPVTAQWTAYVADGLRRSSLSTLPVCTGAPCLSLCTDPASLGDSKRHLGFSTKTCGHSTAVASQQAGGGLLLPGTAEPGWAGGQGSPWHRDKVSAFCSCPYILAFSKPALRNLRVPGDSSTRSTL